ncbi:hypothetical protein [Streptomyces sp. NPDC005485]|uniref:hypothetical protein n=1 Tax=Streptomyces sp. NPDC005485 TaxID=3155591 RepID=UPI0033ACF1A9
MYLVHVRVALPRARVSPAGLGARVRGHAVAGERVDHVSLHTAADGSGVTVGVFVTASAMIAAERVALAVVERTLSCEPNLTGATVTSCSAALVDAYFDDLIAPDPVPGPRAEPHDGDRAPG